MKANLFFIVLAVVFMIFYFLFLYRMEKHSDPPKQVSKTAVPHIISINN